MAQDPAVGPVTLYDAFGNPLPVKPAEAAMTEAPPAMDMVSLPGLEATLNALKMPDLRKMAEEVGASPARSRAITIERILVAFSALKEADEGGIPDIPDTWQAPPPNTEVAPGIQHSVRVRRIQEASGKKGE